MLADVMGIDVGEARELLGKRSVRLLRFEDVSYVSIRRGIRGLEEGTLIAWRGGRVRATLNPFIPKPVTPLQWAPRADVALLRRRIARARRALSKAGVELSTYDPKLAVAQAVLSRGGPELSGVIIEWAHRSPGFGGLRAALRERGLSEERYVKEMDPSLDPPWHRVVEHHYASLRLLRFEYKLYRDNPSC